MFGPKKGTATLAAAAPSAAPETNSAPWRVLSAVVLLTAVGVAGAQQSAPEDANKGEKAAAMEEITVTGSRIKRANDFDVSTPTTVVDASYLENLNITNVGEALTQLPSNISTFQPATTGNSNFFAGSIIPNLRGLNPYFGSRTLALVDGQRFVPTNQGDGLDLNFVPAVLIDHADVVTGGASAAYGSGAIAGVTNFILNRKLEGGKFVADFGETQEQDAKDKHVGVAYGFNFGEGKAHLVLGAEYEDTGNAACLERTWCQRGEGFYPTGPSTYVIGNNLRLTQTSQSGTVFNFNPGATTTLQGNAAGTALVPFAIGQQPQSAGGPFSSFPGGQGQSIYSNTNLTAPVTRKVLDGLFTFALTDSVNMKVDASWGQVRTTNYTAGVTSDFIGPIAADNAYVGLYPGLAGAVGNFVDKQWDEQVPTQTDVETTVWRTVIGFDGKFGDTSWTWDGYYEYGHTYRTQLVENNIHLNEQNLALDSVLVNGVPECRSTATGVYPGGYTADPSLANGCVAISPFGTAPLTAAQKGYVFGNLVEDLTYTQDVVALNASGNLFDGFGAGPVSGAVGAEYRREVGNNVDNPGVAPAVSSDYLIQYGSSFAGKVQVAEAYLETNVPLLKDLPFAHRLDIDAAIRESRYDNNGLAGTDGSTAIHDINTWKLSLNWEPIDWLRFRGSYSKDARAANFRELYYQQLIGAGGDFGFCGPGGSRTQPCNWNLEGNTQLRPEQSKTTTLGFVLTPKDVLPGFQFAADYFRINIKDAIQQANVTAVLQGCETNHIAADCALLVQAPGTTGYTDVIDLTALASNGSGYVYKGVDFTSSYHIDLGGVRSLDLRLLSTWMIDQLYQPVPGGPFVNIVGQVGSGNSFLADFQPTAKWVANYTTTYNQGPVSVTGQVRFVSDGIMNYNGVPIGATPPAGGFNLSTNTVPSYFLFNLNGVYRLPEINNVKMQVFGGINNVANKQPPLAVGVGGFGATNGFGGTNAVFYDTFGRTFKLGVRATF